MSAFSLLRNVVATTSKQISSPFRGTNFTLFATPTYSSSSNILLNKYTCNQQSERFHHSAFATRQMQTSTSISSPRRLPSSHETLLITAAAKKRLKDVLLEDSFLRVIVDSGGCSGFQYKFEMDQKLEEDDIEIHYSGDDLDGKTVLVIDSTSLDIIRGSTLDYEMELIRSAFRIINNPQAEQGCSCGASFNVKID